MANDEYFGTQMKKLLVDLKKLYSWENCIDLTPYFFFITTSFSLDTSDKATSWITANF